MLAEAIGDLGPIALGGTLYVPVQCYNGSGVPTSPDSAPTVKIFSGTTLKLTATGPSADQGSLTGYRPTSAAITAANGFASGQRYEGIVTYAVSGTNHAQPFTFSVT